MKAFYFLILSIIIIDANEQEVEWFDAEGKLVRVTQEQKAEKEPVASELLKNESVQWNSRRTFRNRTTGSRGIYFNPYWSGYSCHWPNYYYRGWTSVRYTTSSAVFRNRGSAVQVILGR